MIWYYRLKVPLFNWKEERWVKKQFYHDEKFKNLDLELLDSPNPYPIAKVFPYGETPLRVLYKMAQALDLKPTDHFIDLGCGRGRAVFFLSHFFGCRSTGIDLTPSFITRAKKLVQKHNAQRVNFYCQDFLNFDLKEATCIYLYGTTYPDEWLEKLTGNLPQNVAIVSVSQAMPMRSNFYLGLKVAFPWGRASLYIHDNRANKPPAFDLVLTH